MSVIVHIPAAMARHTGGEREVEVCGGSVGEVLGELQRLYPDMRQALCDERGRLLRFVAVFANGTDIRAQQGLDTPLADTGEVDIVSAIAGG